MKTKHKVLILTGAMVLILGLSILFYLLFGYPRVERVFFFPLDRISSPSGESRRIPRKGTLEDNIREYVQEWLLGPLALENDRLFPRATRLNSILLREEVLYLDFNVEILEKQAGLSLSFQEILDMTDMGIQFNFPSVKTVRYTVDGEPVTRNSFISEPESGVPGASEETESTAGEELPGDSGN